MRDNFIPTVVNFSTDDIRQAFIPHPTCTMVYTYVHAIMCLSQFVCSDENRARMKREFLADPQYNFETVNHASTACGPLVQWAIAQVCAVYVCH